MGISDALVFWPAGRALAGLDMAEMASAFWRGIYLGFLGCQGAGGLGKIVSCILPELSTSSELLTLLLWGRAEHPGAGQTFPSTDT